MKRFVKNIILFGTALLGFLFVCDAITTYAFHQKRTRVYAVWNDIMHMEINADVLIMGNSRAWGQYSPIILDSILGVNVYNLGFDGSSFERQLARYDIYRHYQSSKPNCIIQNVEYSTLGRTMGYEKEQFMPYMMYPFFRNRIMEVEPFNFAELYIPMYRYYMNNFYISFTSFDYVVTKGFYSEDIEWDGTQLNNVKPFEQYVDYSTYKLFINYIEQAKRDSIELIFVIAPIYKDVWTKVINMKEIHQMYYDLSMRYELPMLDYSNCYLSQDTTYFYNATHLNKTGSDLFSAQLAYDLDSLGIILK